MQAVLQEKTCGESWVDLNPKSSQSNHFNEYSRYTLYYCKSDHTNSHRYKSLPSAFHNPKKLKPFSPEIILKALS